MDKFITKLAIAAFAAITMFLLAGCETEKDTTELPVRLGMSRDALRERFGEPVRIERPAEGGEDWIYRFRTWKSEPSGDSGTATDSFGGQTSYVSVSMTISKDTVEKPVHLSPDGFVIEPVPEGKVVKD